MWAGRPPNEESLIIMRGRLGCVTYYARDYARDYARAPTGDLDCILMKNTLFSIMRSALACVTYYARDYARDYARPPTGDWGYILKQISNILCESNGMSIAWMPIDCPNCDSHHKNDGICYCLHADSL